MRKFPLILSFAIIAIGFGVSLHRSLTGNGLLAENLDTHILAQLDGAGDDTGGDDTTGGGTGGDDTGGTDNPDRKNYKKDALLCSWDTETSLKSDNDGVIQVGYKSVGHYLPNTYYKIEYRTIMCLYLEGAYCDWRKENIYILSEEVDKDFN